MFWERGANASLGFSDKRRQIQNFSGQSVSSSEAILPSDGSSLGRISARRASLMTLSDLGEDRMITLATDGGPLYTAPKFSDYISGTPFRHVPRTTRPFQSLGMIRRLMWTLKDEEMNLREYRNPIEAQFSLERFRRIYNFERPHQALRYRLPADLFCRKSDDSA
jgi:transposase InsO family protein